MILCGLSNFSCVNVGKNLSVVEIIPGTLRSFPSLIFSEMQVFSAGFTNEITKAELELLFWLYITTPDLTNRQNGLC